METPEEFPFPFTPYPIQTDFMKNLYYCLENSKCGIFESPTGTGKTLSIICGAVKWLLDNTNYKKDFLISQINEINEKIKNIEKKYNNDWFSAQAEILAITKDKEELQKQLDQIIQHDEKLQTYKNKVKLEDEAKKLKFKNIAKYKKLKESNSDCENKNAGANTGDFEIDKEETDDYELILKDTQVDSSDSEKEEETNEYECTKIIFCSRTHSQLGQFIHEMKKSIYANDVALVPIASRYNYCINNDVRRLGTNEGINDRCLQLQKLKKKATVKKEKVIKKAKTTSLSRCQYMPGNQLAMGGAILGEIKDVEDIVKTSKELETCAYYATRKIVKDGQVILVPYNSVLHRNTRISSGINLKGNILIIDEAHNLLDAIERMNSATVFARDVLHCFQQLSRYQSRFQTKLSAISVLSLNQLSHFLKKVLSLFGGSMKSQLQDPIKIPQKVYDIIEFQELVGIDNIFELLKFISRTKLVHKLRGYADKYETGVAINTSIKINETKGVSAFLNSLQLGKNNSNAIKDVETSKVTETSDNEMKSNPLMSIVCFLECLQANWKDGRIFLLPGATFGQSMLKFILLNPASHFTDIVQEARAIILAGGTMAPMEEFRDHLLINAGVEPERIITFSCDHIVPKENICTVIQTCGPTGIEFDFKFQNRGNTAMMDELGRTLVNLLNIVPAGVVVFLPSYNVEDTIYKHFESTGVLKKLALKKKIFREPKLASQVNKILEKYADAVKKPNLPQNGALLFSVVGGKLSEGLNFSDDLGRCIIVVGMPFPNIKSVELTEKMKYLNNNCKGFSGQIYYENLCYKAVNQCIGRAVRHIKDYSSIILIDKRYSSKVNFLPTWIQRSNVYINTNFGKTISTIAKFFSTKRKAQLS